MAASQQLPFETFPIHHLFFFFGTSEVVLDQNGRRFSHCNDLKKKRQKILFLLLALYL
jgi:ABC-type taurine transport system substrate-binding protein